MSNNSQQKSVIPDLEDAPTAPVEVDIDAGTATVVEQTQEKTKFKIKPRHQERIHRIGTERDEARSYAAQLQQENDKLRRERDESRAEKERAERAGMTNYAARVDADVQAAQAELLAAKEAKNDQAEVAAQLKLAKAAAAATDVDTWRATQPKEGEQQPQTEPKREQQQPRQDAQYVPPPEPVRNFMVENSWFSQIKLDESGHPVRTQDGQFALNPDFDEDLHEEAMSEHRRVQREIKLGRLKQDFYNSPEYFQRIQDRVAQTFPDAFDESEEEPAPPPKPRTPPMSQTRQPVAPAQRQSQPSARPQSSTKSKLDGDEVDIVRKLVDNNTMLYPRNHPDPNKAGKRMSYDDAYVEYAKKRQADPGSQQGG